MQLVLKNNRVVAHGEGFLLMGNRVINTETGAEYENTTIAECESCPPDIGQVGYEYHAGEFVPCAPFGKGSGGTVPVLCDDECKAIKDSGIDISDVLIYEYDTFTMSSSQSSASHQSLFNNKPVLVFLFYKSKENYSLEYVTIASYIAIEVDGKTKYRVTFSGSNGLSYKAVALCVKG